MNREYNDFRKFANSVGVGTARLDKFATVTNPYVVEERQMNITSISVFSRLLMDRQIFLGGEIDDDLANIINAQMLWLESNGDGDITLNINSGGGSVYDGFAIVDTMDMVKCDVSTVVVGLAASMASVIASNGTKGKRHILPHSRFMIHQPMSSLGRMSQASDIEIQSREINTLKKELIQILSKNSRVELDQVRQMCDRDTWLTSYEAVNYGFMDDIVGKNSR